jgi:hypothetical protein
VTVGKVPRTEREQDLRGKMREAHQSEI